MDYPLLTGMLFGLSIAAPVGPIGLLCIRRTMQFGFRNGFISGLGAASADLVYGFAAVYGMGAISTLLLQYKTILNAAGSLFLFYLAWKTFTEIPSHDAESPADSRKRSAFLTTFFLTLTNPMTILSFAALLSSFSASISNSQEASWLLISGVFLGSALWWGVLAAVTDRVNGYLSFPARIWINRGSGALLFGFAVIATVSIF